MDTQTLLLRSNHFLGICNMYCYCWSIIQTIYISTFDEICAWCCISEDRKTTNTCSTYALNMLYRCSKAWGFFYVKTSSANQQCTWTNLKIKNHITGSNIKLTIKNQTVYFSIRNVPTQNSRCNNVNSIGLWAYLYMYLFSYHDQLFKGNDDCFLL